MKQSFLTEIIFDQTKRALWEVKNVIACVPDALWSKKYCNAPLWKHIYHMLHSLDLWFVNPRDPNFKEPSIHEKDLNHLDIMTPKQLNRSQIEHYFAQIQAKTERYLASLQDEDLLDKPKGCEYTKFTLIMAQHRHLHTHMGMIMGFIVAETGLWPKVVGLEGEILQGDFARYYE